MKTGVFLRNIDDWAKIAKDSIGVTDYYFIGNYGCSEASPELLELLECAKRIEKFGGRIHYISPKINQVDLESEQQKVITLLESGISVSINDWGLLYGIRERIKPGHSVFLGRLLSKSLADWPWFHIIAKEENEPVKDFFSQNSLNHKVKLDFLKSFRIKGMEVNIHSKGILSYQEIKKQGFSLIGFKDDIIVSVSRACPMKIQTLHEGFKGKCAELCSEKYNVIPISYIQREVYPEIKLSGNVLYRPRTEDVKWKGFDVIVHNAESSFFEKRYEDMERKTESL